MERQNVSQRFDCKHVSRHILMQVMAYAETLTTMRCVERQAADIVRRRFSSRDLSKRPPDGRTG